MESIIYVSTADTEGNISVVRLAENPSPSPEVAAPFPQQFTTVSVEIAEQLAWLLLYDCLHEDQRADRLQRHLTELLIWPLVQRKNWILTNDEIEAAVQSIELLEGWLWLDGGYYLDQDPALELKPADRSRGGV